MVKKIRSGVKQCPLWTVRYSLGRVPEERRFGTLAAALAWADFVLAGRECDVRDPWGRSLWDYTSDEAAALAEYS
jgi:hypothetical protein